MAKNPGYLPKWCETVGAMKDEGAYVVCSCMGKPSCGAFKKLDLDKIIEKLGRDYSLVGKTPPCPGCGQATLLSYSPGPGTPTRPLRRARESEQAMVLQLRAQKATREPHTVTNRDIVDFRWLLQGECGPCEKVMTPDIGAMLSTAHLKRPIAAAFREGYLRCHTCKQPLAGLTILGAMSPGGIRDQVAHYYQPGSPADPVVRAYWKRARRAAGR